MKFKIFLLLLLLPAVLSASSYFPQFYHVYKPAVGEWSKYEIVDNTGQKAILTISVVGKEKDLFWIEVESSIQGETGLAAFLVSGDPTDDSNVLKVRLKSGDGPIIEIDKATLEKLKASQQNISSSFGIGPTVGKIQGLPNETLKVAGRNFSCTRVRLISPEGRSADIWLSDEAAPFGVAKLISGEESLTLLDAGKGAKPRLLGAATPLVLEGK
jgi:hypothetical protein